MKKEGYHMDNCRFLESSFAVEAFKTLYSIQNNIHYNMNQFDRLMKNGTVIVGILCVLIFFLYKKQKQKLIADSTRNQLPTFYSLRLNSFDTITKRLGGLNYFYRKNVLDRKLYL